MLFRRWRDSVAIFFRLLLFKRHHTPGIRTLSSSIVLCDFASIFYETKKLKAERLFFSNKLNKLVHLKPRLAKLRKQQRACWLEACIPQNMAYGCSCQHVYLLLYKDKLALHKVCRVLVELTVSSDFTIGGGPCNLQETS